MKGRIPRLWRKRRGSGGKFYGSYYVTLKTGDVNLKTSDANEAERRRREAIKGRRNFADELLEAADAFEGLRAVPELSGTASPGASPDPGIRPDAYVPPPPLQLAAAPSAADARAEAEATNASAAEAGTGGAAGAGSAGPDLPFADPNVLDGMLELGAHGLVDLQLWLQAFAIRRRFNRIAGEVPIESPLRQMAVKAWVIQLKLWVPSINPPAWVIATVLPLALCVGEQLPRSQPIPKPEAQPEAPHDAQAAA